MKRKIALLISLLFIVGFFVIPNQIFAKGQKALTIRVGYVDSGGGFDSETINIAQQKGFFKKTFGKSNVKIELIPFKGAGPAINEAIGSGNLDIAFYGDTPALLGRNSGLPTKLVGISRSSLTASLVVWPDSDIKSVKDLKGKKVVTLKGSFMHRFLVELLKSNGLSTKDIEFYSMNGPESEAAITAKQVDAFAASYVNTAKLVLNKNGKVLVDTSKHPKWRGISVITATESFAKANPEALITFLSAINQANAWVKKNPDAAIKIWAKGTGIEEDVFRLAFPTKDFALDINLTKDILERLDYNKDFLVENKLIRNDFELKSWVDASYLKKALGKKK